ncbi:hypothetical protein F4009_13965 [Candidatus Poribacteria bacterium]|nr:hypothetical protein [Candidatus Poribacteria bacterium]MYH80614.1 hypothetical protein [Candidatus Poribacteria bacterium]MYK95080.1 hypothetical protein [Candidatus Poribacteria bacterium]
MTIMTTWLKCAECNEMFEVSNEIADAMRRWRDESGEPFTCGDCAGVDETITIETDTELTTDNH